MFGLGFWELAVIFVVALLVLGPRRLPELATRLGKGLRDLRRASADLHEAVREPLREIQKPLQDIRDDFLGTAREVENNIRQELSVEHPRAEANRPLDLTPLDITQRQIEKVYADAAAEDAAMSTSENASAFENGSAAEDAATSASVAEAASESEDARRARIDSIYSAVVDESATDEYEMPSDLAADNYPRKYKSPNLQDTDPPEIKWPSNKKR